MRTSSLNLQQIPKRLLQKCHSAVTDLVCRKDLEQNQEVAQALDLTLQIFNLNRFLILHKHQDKHFCSAAQLLLPQLAPCWLWLTEATGHVRMCK